MNAFARLTNLRREIRRVHAYTHAVLRDNPGIDLMWTDEMRRGFLADVEEANRLEWRKEPTKDNP